jgi:peroxiredoxin
VIKVGDVIPQVTLQRLTDNGVISLNTQEVFRGETVVLFGVPGAFTPTCSAAHLPGFIALAGEFYQHGVDRIICTSVNDAYVMGAWAKDQNAGDLMLLADGAGKFATALGVANDSGDFGGIRSLRYAMLVVDGVVRQFAVDAPKTFELTNAEQVLRWVKPTV